MHIQCCSALDFLQRSIKTCLLSISRRADVRPPPETGSRGPRGSPTLVEKNFRQKSRPLAARSAKQNLLGRAASFWNFGTFSSEIVPFAGHTCLAGSACAWCGSANVPAVIKIRACLWVLRGGCSPLQSTDSTLAPHLHYNAVHCSTLCKRAHPLKASKSGYLHVHCASEHIL